MVLRQMVLFVLGGLGYVGVELCWRGWSHYSMFLLGGTCFVALGQLQQLLPDLSLPVQLLVGWGLCIVAELVFGLVFNRRFQIWDYRAMPGNFLGQICPAYCCLWLPLSVAARALYHWWDQGLRSWI